MPVAGPLPLTKMSLGPMHFGDRSCTHRNGTIGRHGWLGLGTGWYAVVARYRLIPRLSPHPDEKSEGEPENEVHKGHFSPLHQWAYIENAPLS